MAIQIGGTYMTAGAPGIPGVWPAVAPERIRVTREVPNVTSDPDDRWYLVRFLCKRGGSLVMHESKLHSASKVPA